MVIELTVPLPEQATDEDHELLRLAADVEVRKIILAYFKLKKESTVAAKVDTLLRHIKEK